MSDALSALPFLRAALERCSAIVWPTLLRGTYTDHDQQHMLIAELKIMCRLFFFRSQTWGSFMSYHPFFWFIWLNFYRDLSEFLFSHVGWIATIFRSGKLSYIAKTFWVLFEHIHIRYLAWLCASKLQFLWNWPGWFECKLPLNGTSVVHTATEWMR